MTEGLFSQLEERGYRGRIISIQHLAEDYDIFPYNLGVLLRKV